jgi:8-oxo-dGTP pyrophosphatase MutT (NUDIX family)
VTFRSAIHALEIALKGPPPGRAAHAMLAPRPPREWPKEFSASALRHAAGLLLLFPVDDRPHLVLTVRAETLGRHGGQISLPGGVIEPGESVEQAALREAHEEIALNPDDVKTLGRLEPLDIPVSGFRLHPVVGCLDEQPLLHPADGEVARILELPVDAFLDPGAFGCRTAFRDGRTLQLPTFFVGGVEIWGATAMALAELLVLLGWSGPPVDRQPDRAD